MAGLLSGLAEAAPTSPTTRTGLSRYVDLFIGTGGHGHTYPGATVPFGMVQLSPDTGTEGWDHCSGYHFDDKTLMGFSHTHLSGTGCADLLDILVTPNVGPPEMKGYRLPFSHADEHAEPGYYSVRLANSHIFAELTATSRVGLHRYTFPANEQSHFLVDLEHGVAATLTRHPHIKSSELRVEGNDTVVGSRETNDWAKHRQIHFVMKFSRPFQVSQKTELKLLLSTPTQAGEVILVKVGLSFVSVDGARRNLERELPGWDFQKVREEARQAWESELGKIVVETDRHHLKRIFYTGLYHTMLAPTLFSDVDGSYRGMDGATHHLTPGAHDYSTYSLWDTYRALHPLCTLIHPKRLADLMNSLVLMAEQSPQGVPVWPLQGCETGCMIGYHSVVVLAEAYAKGVKGVEYAKAYSLFRKRAFQENYQGLDLYRKYGWVPCDRERESASKTLEYAYDDWALAHLARAAGNLKEEGILRERSRNYRHLFDKSSQFMRPRSSEGQFYEPFDPRSTGNSPIWPDFTESNSWQATFLNQHDIHEYIKMFGGDASFLSKLDALFNQSSELPPGSPPDIAGMVGQYAHGNEPSHHIAYLYAYAGSHQQTQARIRSLLEGQYSDKPDGLAGNEDCGQISAWFILSSLGFYAVDPVSGNYVFGSPIFDSAVVDLGNGHRLTLKAVNQGPRRPYIQSVTWNGKPYSKSWFNHRLIAGGGTFEFTMGERPNPGFGKDPADRPPSFS